MSKTRLFIAVTVIIAFSFAACNKDAVGPKGDKGDPGKGIVSSSGTFAVNLSDWDSTGGTQTWRATIPYSLITSEVISSAAVQVYMQSGNTWWNLPYGQDDDVTLFGLEEGKVILRRYNLHSNMPDRPATTNFRIVIVTQ